MNLVIDSSTHILEHNSALSNFLRGSDEPITGQPLKHFLHPDDEAQLHFQVQHCHKTGQLLTNTVRLLKYTGNYAWFNQEIAFQDSSSQKFYIKYEFLAYDSFQAKIGAQTPDSSQPEAVIFSNSSPPKIHYTSPGWAFVSSHFYQYADEVVEHLVDSFQAPGAYNTLQKAIDREQPASVYHTEAVNKQPYLLQLFHVQDPSYKESALLFQQVPWNSGGIDSETSGLYPLTLLPTHNPNPIIQVTTDGTIAFYNTAAQPLMQYWDVDNGQHLPEPLMVHLPENPTSPNKQFEVKAGNTIYGGITCQHDNDHYCLYLIDVTKERTYQQKLTHHQQLLDSINQHIQEGIFRSTPADGLVYVNEPFAKLFGYESAAEILAANASLLYANSEDRRHLIREEQAYGGLKNRPVKFCRKDGSTFWGLLSSKRLLDDQGQVFYDGAIRDITREMKVQKQLEKAKQEAEELDQLKSHFLANMSHEVRTPLNGILGLIQLIEKEYQNDDNLIGYTGMIRESGERLLKTLNSIIAFSRLETGAIPKAMGTTDLARSLSSILTPYEKQAMKNGLNFYKHVNPAIPPLAVSPEIFQHIVQNLVDNALKFTHKGSITIKGKLSHDHQYALITVADTGIGITIENQEQIFNAFFQESQGHKRIYEGPGLGLPIVKRFTHLCGGAINLKSRKNRGAVFQVTIPLAENHGTTTFAES